MPSTKKAGRPSRGLRFAVLFVLLSCRFIGSSAGGGGDGDRGRDSDRWQILTEQNFSSQIRQHSYVLLMVTVPWCGESRALMKELAHAVANKEEKFGSLKLMLLYRNNEKMLAGAMNATNGISIFYYHRAVPYRYRGRLEVKNILSSAHYLMSLLPEEIPLKPLNTPEDLENFLTTADKTILVFEFCGWSPRLLAGTNIGTENARNITGFNEKTNGTYSLSEKKYHEVIGDKSISCSLKNEFSKNWIEEFSSVDRTPDALSCTFEEFQHFDSFFSKLVTTAREFFLPPERQRFGLVSDKALLSTLGIEDSGSWLAMLYFVGCPTCSKTLKEGDDLLDALQMHKSFIMEVEGDGDDLQPALPANEPSILLFVDRSSESSQTRRKSKEALDVFRNFVLQNQIYQTAGQSNGNLVRTLPLQASQVSNYERRYLQSKSSQSHSSRLRDKMSVVIVNEGGHVALDNVDSNLQGSTLCEVLAYVLQQQKKAKFSSVAKQAGFQLLSNDFDIKIEDLVPSPTENRQSNPVSLEIPMQDSVSHADLGNKDLPSEASASTVNHNEQSTHTQSKPVSLEIPLQDSANHADLGNEDLPPGASAYALKHKEQSTHADIEHSSPHNKESLSSMDATGEEMSLEVTHYNKNGELTKDLKIDQEFPSEVEKLGEQQEPPHAFKGSFFFSDGGHRLLKALTTTKKIPSMVIIDPISQQHYVFPQHTVFSYSSLVDFVDGFLNGSLFPHQQSEPFVISPRKGTHPPFVNLDFHEADGIPRVTSWTFSEMVLGSNQSDASIGDNAWKMDVLVFFSNSWCGFCQRMDMIVREVYRALKGYVNLLKSAPENAESTLGSDSLGEEGLKLPLIYLMDCTLNDCSLILKSMGQKELFPSLLLFPAERKHPVTYGGDMAVTSIMRFIADHGSNSRFITEKGIIWTDAEVGGANQDVEEKQASSEVDKHASTAQDNYRELILEDRTMGRAVKDRQTISYTSGSLHRMSPRVIAGYILLATDKLLGAQIFEEAWVLIVKADQNLGFQGLIINKHIKWKSLDGLGEGFELLKEAPLSLGGPLVEHKMPLLSLRRKFVKDDCPEVLPGVYFLDQSATVNEIQKIKSGNHSLTDYWFFLGFSSWAWDQLFDEISDGAWNINSEAVGLFEWP